MPPKKGSAGDNGSNDSERRGGNRLVIVESPAKAKTIAGYLGRGYVVESSIGHIRDLPTKAAEIPARYKGEPWARLGVDVDHDFEPLYVVNTDKKSQVKRLKELLSEADELFLATDEDREGEAIAWHLREELKPKVPVRRMVFNEITKDAIRRAAENTRDLNLRLVNAQETRRILDRLYGYEVSPVLWKKVMPKLSAGRVQSVATRLVVERERERIAFVPADYWGVKAVFDSVSGRGTGDDPAAFTAHLVSVDGARVAVGRDFTSAGELRSAAGVLHLDEDAARGLVRRLDGSDFAVRTVESKPYKRSPYAPFRTTTLQQEASRKLNLSSKQTMQVAQRLYENGFITYMRTDSTTLSESAVAAARDQATRLYGADYVPAKPRVYASKVKNAQEAHEAIRPAGDTFRTPAETGLSGAEFRLYELIWKRTVASQMKDAVGESVTVKVEGTSSTGEVAEFTATGKIISFHGFLKAYVEGSDDPNAELDDRERRLPPMEEGDPLKAEALEAEGHSTRPPARYTEASLVKELEDREIGRPSTYASIIGTILDRGYVFKKGSALVPSFLAFAVVQLMERHFGNLVDYDFTARMEDMLDDIARGETESVPWLRRFYFGAEEETGLKTLVDDQLSEIDPKEVSSFPLAGTDIVIRVGRYGPYMERLSDGQRVNIPEDIAPDELTPEKAEELFAQPSGDRELGTDPETGRRIVARNGRFGPYVTEVLEEPDDSAEAGGAKARSKAKAQAKPRTASLLKSMSLDTVTLEDALRLLSLPRVVGEIDGEEVTAQNGRFGPYLRKGTDSRSLETEEQMFTVTIEQARELFSKPKQRGRRAAAAAPLRELGNDPETGKPMVIKDGRFGPYVTDGETNASLRKGDEVESITDARAAELLAERRAKAPAKKAPAKRSTAKKSATTTAKKPAAKARSGAGAKDGTPKGGAGA
ncbi:type I DNA topoisomerase [Streptomonospora nanhaiensis]|uniref:DNA topoisomerase 1 n=1 Tax=Streptomonospora nanhaiensis TaxID=1323731 RepID=A0A853BPL7_9ACTN|nr:type I DNA topoisomerase [Streptomonospora nanhaiensis]MBV2365779.1 type I DNA topoisomerase [Streptomonospora nanhaiensis]MBX9388074.1 type I DNA topoisomerase [Streptomonospora nanhaiensis]NYI96461.1 DNA topoisomerase-1 [Streptomonospora nanhaiensis]